MRHKYATEAIVLARTPLAEAGVFATLLTSEFGLIRAIVTGVRRSGAKLASSLQTFDESAVILVKGKDAWRLTGAVLAHDHFHALTPAARERAGRISLLLLRLVRGESLDAELFPVLAGFISALPALDEAGQDAAEIIAALRLLGTLGLDAGPRPQGYDEAALSFARDHRSDLIRRINRGIQESGL